MRLVVLFLLIITLQGSLALSEGEERAVSDLLKEWPFLAHVFPPWTSNSSEACIAHFKGLICSYGPEEHIISLKISTTTYYGQIPESIGGLFWLQNLNLEVHGVNGSLPDSVGNLENLASFNLIIRSDWNYPLPVTLHKLANLIELDLSLSGYLWGFPEGIVGMKNLQHLSMTEFGALLSPIAPFYGSIPVSFCDLDQLVELKLSSVALSGLDICAGKLPNLEILQLVHTRNMSIPLQSLLVGRPRLTKLRIEATPVFGPLELEGQINFESIHISGTEITGTVPHSLGNNKELVEFIIPLASIGGTIPSSIGQLSRLRMVDIHETLISGSIPREIGLCKSLETFHASETRISGTLPAEIGNLSNLSYLDLTATLLVGSIPNSVTGLLSLNHLKLDRCKLVGTIPRGLLSLPMLATFTATESSLTGTIPDEISSTCDTLILTGNHLEGSIPASALRHCHLVDLSQNRLSGHIANLSLNSELERLYLSENAFSGSLPFISNAPELFYLDLSSNHFSGTIPHHYRAVPFRVLDLTQNQLEGDISIIFEIRSLQWAKLGYNRFSGPIPNSISTHPSLTGLSISSNFLSGTIPPLSSRLVTLSASGNLLHGTLDNLFSQVGPRNLQSLDLSHNLLEGTVPPISSFNLLNFLSLASNNLSGSIPGFRTQGKLNLQVLDLSNNRLEGQFPFHNFLEIANLLLANNSFHGHLLFRMSSFGTLSILDISNNHFTFDASFIDSNSFISVLSAQNNHIYGRLALSGLPSLKYADFSHNNITEFDFESIHKLSHTASLNSIAIKNNLIVEPAGAFEQLIRDGTLTLSSSTTPSVEHQGVICSHLLIGNNDKTQFLYDESMFSFQQCQCDRDHFGLPPYDCHPCDTLKPGSTLCNGNLLHVGQNYYVYNDSKSLHTEMCVSQFLYSIELNNGHSQISNCLGLMIEFDDVDVNVSTAQPANTLSPEDNSIFPSNSRLALQCRAGSTGRLCTRCMCDMTSIDNTCYFAGPAGICKKCGKVFSSNEFIPISLVVLIVVLVVLSIVFYLILASKRRSKELEWKNLSIGRRIIYRLIDATSFGQITIMVTFVQILVELTHWDAYALSGWLKVVNGESEGLGLRCLFPFLSNPTTMLVLRLVLPVIVIAIVCIGIGLGELIHRFRSYLKHRHHSGLVSDHDTTSDDHDDTIAAINSSLIQTQQEVYDERRKSVPYPAMALATSTSISIVKFLYFGTTMSAVEYLFYSVQKGTNRKYVQSVPWMPFDDASVLRGVSIPFMIVYLFGIPFGFVLMSWKLRHKISSPFVRLYFGSLFENYNVGLFWWELVNVLRKLVVALLLRGLSDGDSFQPFFISLAVGVVAVVITSVRPWKRSVENFFDGLGSILLILSMASNRLGILVHSREVQLIIVVIDGLYIGACLLMIGWRLIGDETSYEKQWKLKFGSPVDSLKLVPEAYGPPLLNDAGDGILSGSEWHELS